MKFHVVIFGCQMNYADAARIRAVLQHCGFFYVENIQDADIVIFDTCSVRQKSEDKITGKLKEIRKDQKIWVTGCMVQHNFRSGKLRIHGGKFEKGNFMGSVKTTQPYICGFENKEIEDLDTRKIDSNVVFVNHAFNPLFHKLTQKSGNIELFWRIDDTGFLPLMLQKLGYEVEYEDELINEYEKIIPEGMGTSMNAHTTTAYVPISSGCNQFCSYCIVPYARGLEKYFSVEDIVKEVKNHLEHGAKEIVLLGQIVNKHPEFVKIVQEVLGLDGLKWLRYTSPYPTYYSPELLSLHEKNVKLCPHIHMPLQSGSDVVLKRMFRGYTVQEAKKFIDALRNLDRDISLTTDIIVGFPGETEEDFLQTLDLVRYGQFDMIYIGIYSSRPGTYAAKHYPDDLPHEIKWERWSRLNDLLNTISKTNNQKEIGQVYEVLINEIKSPQPPFDKEGLQYIGYTENMKQIIITPPAPSKIEGVQIGEFVQVEVTESSAFKLGGKVYTG